MHGYERMHRGLKAKKCLGFSFSLHLYVMRQVFVLNDFFIVPAWASRVDKFGDLYSTVRSIHSIQARVRGNYQRKADSDKTHCGRLRPNFAKTHQGRLLSKLKSPVLVIYHRRRHWLASKLRLDG